MIKSCQGTDMYIVWSLTGKLTGLTQTAFHRLNKQNVFELMYMQLDSRKETNKKNEIQLESVDYPIRGVTLAQKEQG